MFFESFQNILVRRRYMVRWYSRYARDDFFDLFYADRFNAILFHFEALPGTGFIARRPMGLGALPLGSTRRYVERVQRLLRGEMVDWDFEDADRKIRFLNPDLGLINLDDEVPLWFSAFGPRAKKTAAGLKAGWLNFGTQGAQESLDEMREIWQEAGNDAAALEANLFFLGAVLDGDSAAEPEAC